MLVFITMLVVGTGLHDVKMTQASFINKVVCDVVDVDSLALLLWFIALFLNCGGPFRSIAVCLRVNTRG